MLQGRPRVTWAALGKVLLAGGGRRALYPALLKTHQWAQCWAPTCKRDMGLLERVSKGPMEMTKGPECLSS